MLFRFSRVVQDVDVFHYKENQLIVTNQWEISKTWILICLLVASFKGSDRLKHVAYHGVQHIVILWSTFCFFAILTLNG